MTETKNVIIIGGGIGGMTAGIYASRNGAAVTLFERQSVGGQIALTDRVDNYPGTFGISGIDLALAVQSQAEAAGVKFIYEEVTGIDLKKKVAIADKEYRADSLILAMGQSPRKLGIENEEQFLGRGISFCAVCDGMFYKNKTVVVVGGGNTAVQDAVHLSKLCKKVYLVHRRTQFRADIAETKKLGTAENIEVLTPYLPESILSGNGKLAGLKILHRETNERLDLQADGIFLAIGYTPNTALIDGLLPLTENGYIKTNAHAMTRIKNVFACGDIVEKPLRQLATAASDGAIAGQFASF